MHEGHRERMYAKLKNAENLYDHEILEILLFTACPRVNTNPVAHALLERFGSLAQVFSASEEELKKVDGVGERTADFLKVVGFCAERVGKVEGVAHLKNTADCKAFVSMRLKGRTEEFLELYFIDKSGLVKRIFSYTSADRNRVSSDASAILSDIALIKPAAIVAAHNHLNGFAAPSQNDELFTRQLQLMCDMSGVDLWDHLIYASDGNFYSYRSEGVLDEIKKDYKLKNIKEWTKKKS